MKKLFALIVTSLLVITLASCNNTTVDYTLHDTDNSELKVVQEWLSSKNIATQATPVVARESKAVAGYEVFLPTDMVAASRYVVVDLENNVYNGNNICNTSLCNRNKRYINRKFRFNKIYDSSTNAGFSILYRL